MIKTRAKAKSPRVAFVAKYVVGVAMAKFCFYGCQRLLCILHVLQQCIYSMLECEANYDVLYGCSNLQVNTFYFQKKVDTTALKFE